MRFSLLLLAIFSFMGCYSSKERLQQPRVKQELYPYLKKNGNYIYVDTDFTPVLPTEYRHADLFTSTGYAVVQNEQEEYAVINRSGETVVSFSERYLSLQVLTDQLTVVMRRETYTKTSRFWEWEWTIFSGLNTTVSRQKFDVFILETDQVLYSKKLSAKASLPSHVQLLDDQHFVFNETLYIRKGKRLVKQAGHIIDTFNNQRVLQQNGEKYTLLNANKKRPERQNLEATDQLSFLVEGEKMVLNGVNQRRYYSTVPHFLYDSDNQTYWIEPQFDKAFPKALTLQAPEQLDYLQKVSYVNSIPDYPYFILGVFDYDAWVYDWKYVSETGQLLDSIDAPDFFVLDVVSRVHRPYTSELITADQLPENTTLKKITKNSSLNHVFKITIKDKAGVERVGLWNTQTKNWDLAPIYQDLYWLDVDLGLLAVAQEEYRYQLYDYETKQTLTSSIYKSIYTSGWVTVEDAMGKQHQFYIDFKTRKEYRE